MKFTCTTLRRPLLSLTFILLSGWAFLSFAQPANNSPYARYGLGNLNNGANVRSAGVGGMSIAMREDSIPFLVNFLNPASYTSLGFTAFDIGLYGNFATISSSTRSQDVNRANLSYFAFGFPVLKVRMRTKLDSLDENGKRVRVPSMQKRILWGGAFGLREFSSVNYAATDARIDDTGYFGCYTHFRYAYKFQGNGGADHVVIRMCLSPV